MDLFISSNLIIPSNEYNWRFSRSSGPGGQNVNKTDSKVQIVFNLRNSKTLNDLEKSKIRIHLKNKLINDCICISVQEKRTQYQNRQIALFKLANLINSCLSITKKSRKATKPSETSQQKRIDKKKKHGQLKKFRSKNYLE